MQFRFIFILLLLLGSQGVLAQAKVVYKEVTLEEVGPGSLRISLNQIQVKKESLFCLVNGPPERFQGELRVLLASCLPVASGRESQKVTTKKRNFVWAVAATLAHPPKEELEVLVIQSFYVSGDGKLTPFSEPIEIRRK